MCLPATELLSMPDKHYLNWKLAEIYDLDSPWSIDRDFYLSLAGAPPQRILVYDDYVGQYQLEISPDYAVAISVEASKLMMEIKQPVGRIKAELLPESETRFFRTDVDVQVTFVKDERGKVTGLIVHQQGAEYRAKRIG
jgi:hypothetical protein